MPSAFAFEIAFGLGLVADLRFPFEITVGTGVTFGGCELWGLSGDISKGVTRGSVRISLTILQNELSVLGSISHHLPLG